MNINSDSYLTILFTLLIAYVNQALHLLKSKRYGSIALLKVWQNKKGLSTIIVVALGLVILVTIVVNVFLWNYEMNQFDWERAKEIVEINSATLVTNSSWYTTYKEYTVNVGTLVNGSYQDTQVIDNVSETFVEGLSSQIEQLQPISPGHYSEWGSEYPASTPHWDCCDETSPDEDGTFVENNAASWKKESYKFQNSTGFGIINWVRIYIRGRTTQEGSSPLRTLLRIQGNDYESNDFIPTISYQNFYTQYDANPDSSVQWAWNEVDSLEAGASSRKVEGEQYVRMTAVWLVVNYSVPGGQRISANGAFNVDLSTYPLTSIQSIEIQLVYKTNDTGELFYLEAFNWTASVYNDEGFNNTSGHVPTGDWEFYALNLTDKWSSYLSSNGTMHVKFLDKQIDTNQTTIDIDFLAIRVLLDGALMTFRNKGSLTCHLVSLWVNNSTHHQRYDFNIFVNAGETLTYYSSQIGFPEKPYIVKVVTERGNIAVYPVD